MRYFARLLIELQNLVKTHRAGDVLQRPSLLDSVQIQGKTVSYFQMGLRHVDEADERPAVILLHGFGGFFMDWPRVMAPLSRHVRVFAMDLPGWGFSEAREDGGVRFEDDAKVVIEFIQKLRLKKVILAGISYGAGVAWAAGTFQTPEIQEIVLLNPMPPEPLKYLHSTLYRGIFMLNRFQWVAKYANRFVTKGQYKLICLENLKDRRLLDSFYLELGFLVIRQPQIYKNLHYHAEGAWKTDWQDWMKRMASIRIPVQIFQGKDDRVFSLKSARLIQQLIPTSKLTEVDDCGHAMIFDQHRVVTDHLMERCGFGHKSHR